MLAGEVFLRPMQEKDTAKVAELEKQVCSMPWSAQGFSDALQQDVIFSVAEIEGRAEGQIEGRTEGQIDGRIEGQIDGRIEGQIEGRTEGRIEGQIDGRIEGQIEGYCGMYCSLEEGEITNVAVNPMMQRQGIGRKVVEDVLQQASKRGITQVVLEVRVSNHPAITLYEKLGFQEIGIRKGFYEKPKEDAAIMSLELSSI
ncbi:MAG: ribosomal protein S18-alanine N-acetyltransferase [Lachnospiraceae bacterium]